MDEPASSHATPRPRRPHHKSRTGCVQCKQRKVKCDEHKPTCNKCISYGSVCSYLQTHPLARPQNTPIAVSSTPPIPYASNSLPPISLTPPTLSIPSNAPMPANLPIPNFSFPPISQQIPPPLIFSILDMEILHHWTIHGATEFVDFDEGKTLFQTVVPQLAFTHPFLMHQILSLSALHLSQTQPSRNSLYRHASDTHLTTAISLFHPEIRNLTEANCHACFVFSTLMFSQAWTSQDPNRPSTLFFISDSTSSEREKDQFSQMSWMKLHRGSQAILKTANPFLRKGPLEPLWKPFENVEGPNHIPPLDIEDEKQLDFLSQAWNNPSSTLIPETKALLDYLVATLKRVFGLFHTHPEVSPLSAVISWFSMMPDEVEVMFEKKIPEALLVLLHYCVLVREVEHLWWMKGKGRNILETILTVLPPGWEEFTKWPIEKVVGNVNGDEKSDRSNTNANGVRALVRGEETMSVGFISSPS